MLQKRRFIPHLEKWGHSRPFRVKEIWKILASSIWRSLFDVRLLNQCVKTCLRAKRLFLRFARNLRPHCLGEGNRVEHFSDFGGFCSTFEAARAEFGVGGRTFFRFWRILFYFRAARAGFEESGRQKRVVSPVFCLLWLSQSLDSDENYVKAVPSMSIGVL